MRHKQIGRTENSIVLCPECGYRANMESAYAVETALEEIQKIIDELLAEINSNVENY